MTMFTVAVELLAALNLQLPAAQALAPWPLVSWSAGWLIGVAGLLMSYPAMAALTNTAFGRGVLPIPGPVGFSRTG
jgi:hypothetical protein